MSDLTPEQLQYNVLQQILTTLGGIAEHVEAQTKLAHELAHPLQVHVGVDPAAEGADEIDPKNVWLTPSLVPSKDDTTDLADSRKFADMIGLISGGPALLDEPQFPGRDPKYDVPRDPDIGIGETDPKIVLTPKEDPKRETIMLVDARGLLLGPRYGNGLYRVQNLLRNEGDEVGGVALKVMHAAAEYIDRLQAQLEEK